ncbi:hypothetical protein GJAV_G00000970 [Gymnothorax javanicus]|nr:hypothetical protein GJAV_G00000970 [Gymnothorax javanicus]
MAEAGEEGRSEGDLGAELSLADASGSRAEEGGVGERIRGLQFSSDEEDDDDDDEGGRGRRRDSDGGADEELDGAPVIGADEEERDGDGEVDSDMDVGGTPDCPVETDKAADSRSVGSQTDSTRGTVSSSGDPQGSPVADMKMTDAEDPVAVLPAPLSDATDPGEDAAVPPSESQESSRQGGDTPEIRGTSEEGVCIFPPVDIKDEPVDEEYDRALAPQPPAPPRRIKDEPEELVQPQKSSEELRISSVFSVGGNATPPAAPVAAPLPSQSGCARASAAPPRAPPPGPPPESTPPPSGGGGVVRVSCSGCTKVLQKGQTAFQRKGSSQLYCSTVCLTAGYALPASGKPLYPCKTCHSCLKDIPNPKDVITAPLDGDGTMRDFCSQGCLSAFKVKRGSGANANTSSRGSSGSSHMPSAGSASPATDTIKCSVCRMIALVNHEVNYQGTVHKICSDACFARFRSSNNLAMNCCESCGSYCYSGPGQCHLLTIEGATRKFCSQPCLTAYKQKYGRAIPCAGCQTLCPADEAVDGVGSDGKILLYCSAACVGNANGAPNSSFAGRFNMAKKYLTAQELFALIESGDIGVLDDDEGQQEEEEEIEALNDGSFMIELVTGNANDSIEVDPTADDSCLTAADDDDPRDPDYEASEEDNDTDSDDDGTAESTGNTPKSKDTSHNNPANGTIRAVPAGNNDRNPANETVLQLFPVADAPPPKVGKKRVRNPDLWKKNVATKKRNAGLAYINTSGKLVGPSKMGPPCRCKKNCWERLGDEAEIAFKSFWGLGDKNLQDSLLFHGMVCSPVKRRRPKTGEREDTNLQRNYSFKYMIKRSDGMFEEEVCQRAFRSVYGIGSKRFERIRDSAKGCNTSPKDKRGAHGKQPRISEFTKNRVREHIKSFPTRSSHYSRQKNRERKYLHESLNERRMWFLYLHRYEPDELEKIRRKEKANPEVKYWLYCDIFNHEFSLSFGLPRSDTCNMCDRLREDIEKAQKTGNEAKEKELKAQLEFHHRNAEKGYSTLNHMEERAQRGEIDMLTFAFEQNLPSPTLKNSDMFYARLLWTYNFGIHNCGDNTGCTSFPCTTCRVVAIPQFHLALNDGTIRNFCSYNCVVTFQAGLSKAPPPAQVNGTSPAQESLSVPPSGVPPPPQASAPLPPLSAPRHGQAPPPGPGPAQAPPSPSTGVHGPALPAVLPPGPVPAQAPPSLAGGTAPFSHGLVKLSCRQCRRPFSSKPELLQFKGEMMLFCGKTCTEAYRKLSYVTARCEYCKIEKNVRDVVRFNQADRAFCSEGCKLLFKHDLTKRTGNPVRTCAYCLNITQNVIQNHFGGKLEEFCKEECMALYTVLFYQMAKCDWCLRQGKLLDSVKWLGEMKHFCDLSCLLFFCRQTSSGDEESRQHSRSGQCEQQQASSTYDQRQGPSNTHDQRQATNCSYDQRQAPSNSHEQRQALSSAYDQQRIQNSALEQRQAPSGAYEPQQRVQNCTLELQHPQLTSALALPPLSGAPVSIAPLPPPGGAPAALPSLPAFASKEATPVIANVVSLASAPAGQPYVTPNTALQGAVPATFMQTKINGDASTQTDAMKLPAAPRRALKNKALLCKPINQNKGTLCRPHQQSTESQTDEVNGQRILVLPVPVPIFIPVPVHLYSQYTPVPMGLPVPLPVPLVVHSPVERAKSKTQPEQNCPPDTSMKEGDKPASRGDQGSGNVDSGGVSARHSWEEESTASAPRLGGTDRDGSASAAPPLADVEADFPLESLEPDSSKGLNVPEPHQDRRGPPEGFPPRKREHRNFLHPESRNFPHPEHRNFPYSDCGNQHPVPLIPTKRCHITGFCALKLPVTDHQRAHYPSPLPHLANISTPHATGVPVRWNFLRRGRSALSSCSSSCSQSATKPHCLQQVSAGRTLCDLDWGSLFLCSFGNLGCDLRSVGNARARGRVFCPTVAPIGSPAPVCLMFDTDSSVLSVTLQGAWFTAEWANERHPCRVGRVL